MKLQTFALLRWRPPQCPVRGSGPTQMATARNQNYEYGLRRSDKSSAAWGSLLNFLRSSSTGTRMSSAIVILRQLLHFGPWRVVPIRLIRRLRPIEVRQHASRASLLGAKDANAIAEEIRHKSIAIVGVLPSEFVIRLRDITDRLPVGEYPLMQQVNEDIRDLVEDPGVKDVLRAYLKCEPALLEASLVVGNFDAKHRSVQNSFHFDYAGWESLNLFVYLTDVTTGSAYHIVAKGSHRDVSFIDVLRGSLTEEEAQRRFGSAIQIVTGAAGTLFFENTESFHRRYAGNGRRVILNCLFASHRGVLSYGRMSRAQIDKRDRGLEKLRA
jgi:hypothetical protein